MSKDDDHPMMFVEGSNGKKSFASPLVEVTPTTLPGPSYDAEDEAAVTRGANAGWGLGLTLKDLCGVKHKIAILAAIAALNMVLDGEAEAHCFSVWHYPTPQRGCAVHHGYHAGFVRAAYAPRVVAKREETAPKVAPTPDQNAGDGVTPQPAPMIEGGNWGVEITKLPTVQPWEEIQRAEAVRALKASMGAKASSAPDKPPALPVSQ